MESKKRLVMIIEDEVMLLQAIEKKLQNIGFETVSFTKATDALRYFENDGVRPDAIWLDYYLEDDIDGIAFMHKLNEKSELSDIPVMVVSNSASQDKVNVMMALGVRKYLLKAENRLEDIANTLQQVLEPKDGQQGKKTVLIIDDEELITSALAKKMLEASFDVLVQRNGEDGLKTALFKKPDIILLDMIMPKMDGVTFLQKLREDKWGKEVPVIILTNLESGEEVEKSKVLGVYDYLVKTNWSLSDVLDKVKKALGM